MNILYLDTSSNYLYCGVVSNFVLVDSVLKSMKNDLSSKALPEISDMLKRCNLTPKEINKIIVVNGPGSFTGVRIGVTIAKIFAWSLNIDITTISSLEAMSCLVENYEFIVPAIDARRNYVFAGIYDSNNNCILKNQYLSMSTLETVVDGLSSNYVVVTNDKLNTNLKTIPYIPNIQSIVNMYYKKEPINPHVIEPEYLKLTEAEENRLKND